MMPVTRLQVAVNEPMKASLAITHTGRAPRPKAEGARLKHLRAASGRSAGKRREERSRAWWRRSKSEKAAWMRARGVVLAMWSKQRRWLLRRAVTWREVEREFWRRTEASAAMEGGCRAASRISSKALA